MAAISMTGDAIDVATLSATPNTAQEYSLDEGIRRVEVFFTDGAGTSVAGAYSLTGTDGVAQVTDAATVPAGVRESIVIAGKNRALGGTSIFVSSATASAEVEVRTYIDPSAP